MESQIYIRHDMIINTSAKKEKEIYKWTAESFKENVKLLSEIPNNLLHDVVRKAFILEPYPEGYDPFKKKIRK